MNELFDHGTVLQFDDAALIGALLMLALVLVGVYQLGKNSGLQRGIDETGDILRKRERNG